MVEEETINDDTVDDVQIDGAELTAEQVRESLFYCNKIIHNQFEDEVEMAEDEDNDDPDMEMKEGLAQNDEGSFGGTKDLQFGVIHFN